MRTRIHYIGVIDFDNSVHEVPLHDGLNLITGRSSTGKSSVMEIFDYCMGSEDETIAEGIISEHAAIYFVDMSIRENRYMIGRENRNSYYLSRVYKELSVEEKGVFFVNQQKLIREEFLIQLGLLLGVDLENTKESDEDEKRRGMVGRPSIRNLMPLILQHQSLIANKLALFYRFDERIKKDQTIDQFKIFAGMVNSRYYDLKRRSSAIEKRLTTLESLRDKHVTLCHNIYISLCAKLEQYKQITGVVLFNNFEENNVMTAPEIYLKLLDQFHVFDIAIADDNDQYQSSYAELQKELMTLQREMRTQQIELTKVKSSIKHLEDFKHRLNDASLLQHDVQIDYSFCPFCHQHTDSVQTEAELLSAAYQSVRKNMRMSASLVRPQYELKHKLENQIADLSVKIREVRKNMDVYVDVINKLKRNRSLQVQAYEVVVGIRSLLEEFSKEPYSDEEYSQLKFELDKLYSQLERFNVERNLKTAEAKINENIAMFRENFPFENTLADYQLKFDIDSFEVRFEKGNKFIYLRSLGSGANWLSVHLCLFLAINKYLYDRDKESCVPTVLFLDQPSQVYFPTIDASNEFSAEGLHKSSGINGSVDADMQAVEKVFSNLYAFCQDNPQFQIIVADHADKFKIEGLDDFESIVSARWRGENEGLIRLDNRN